jgi:VanZ family protein
MNRVQKLNLKASFSYWFLTFGYMGLIFYLSSLKGYDLPSLFQWADKLIHLILYLPFAFLLSLSLSKSGVKRYIFLQAFLIVLLYAISDEIHQSYIPGRDASITDIIADSLGALSGCYLAKVFGLRKY